MLPLACCALMLATLFGVAVRAVRRRCLLHRSPAARWILLPYRSPHPVEFVAPAEDVPTLVRLAAWASFAQFCVMGPCLAFALARLRLAPFTPVVVAWLALAAGHAWCGNALIRDPVRAAWNVRNLAHASLALAVPFPLIGAMRFIWANPADDDPGTPGLSIRLVFVSLMIVHALLLLAATHGFLKLPGSRERFRRRETAPGAASNEGLGPLRGGRLFARGEKLGLARREAQ
jgi:hypothetical protein